MPLLAVSHLEPLCIQFFSTGTRWSLSHLINSYLSFKMLLGFHLLPETFLGLLPPSSAPPFHLVLSTTLHVPQNRKLSPRKGERLIQSSTVEYRPRFKKVLIPRQVPYPPHFQRIKFCTHIHTRSVWQSETAPLNVCL